MVDIKTLSGKRAIARQEHHRRFRRRRRHAITVPFDRRIIRRQKTQLQIQLSRLVVQPPPQPLVNRTGLVIIRRADHAQPMHVARLVKARVAYGQILARRHRLRCQNRQAPDRRNDRRLRPTICLKSQKDVL